MFLNDQERATFFKLYFGLLVWVNNRYKIVSGFTKEKHPKSIDSQKAYAIKGKMFQNPKWIDEYLAENDSGELTEIERGIVMSWRKHFITDKFFVMRHQSKYSVFMTGGDDETTQLYGVIGLNHPFSDFFDRSDLPVVVDATILPFQEKIIYDGLFSTYNTNIGPGMRSGLNDSYRISKEKYGIIESFPFNDVIPHKTISPAKKKPINKPAKVSDEKIEEITSLIVDFCNTHLNEEYTEVSLRLLEKLRRKRPSPLLKGKSNTWACGIVYAIGSTNFLFDKSQTPHMRATELASHFGISQSTAGNKAGEIYKYFDMTPFDPEWTLPGKLADNPLVWMFETEEGLVFDARNAPRTIQNKLLAEGLIPFIPPPREKTPTAYAKDESESTASKKQKEKQLSDIKGQLSLDDNI